LEVALHLVNRLVHNPRQEGERLRKVIVDRLAALKAREHEFVRRPQAPVVAPQTLAEASPAAADLVDDEVRSAPEPIRLTPIAKAERRVEVGDTVKFRYLTDDRRTIKVTISKAQSDTSRGIIHHRTPVASALLGAEEGDEVEVLVGSYIRPAVVENISKSIGDS
jgi:hypothetical protein